MTSSLFRKRYRHLLSAGSLFCLAVSPLALSSAMAQQVVPTDPFLTPADVGQIISRVVQEANARHTPAAIAVVDRLGAVLAVYKMAGLNNPANPNFFTQVEPNPNNPGGSANAMQDKTGSPANPQKVGLSGLKGVILPEVAALAKAITGAYLSTSGGNAFSTRVASQIIQNHFDPGENDTPSGPLYGVQFSQLPCSDLSVRFDPNDGSSLTRGPHRSPLGFSGDPGGFPLYKNGRLVGAIGVKAEGTYRVVENIQSRELPTDEALALAGTIGNDAPPDIVASKITVGGHTLRYTNTQPNNLKTDPSKAPPFASLPAGTGSLIAVRGYYGAKQGLRTGSGYNSPAIGIRQETTRLYGTQFPAMVLVDGNNNLRFPPISGTGPGALTAAEVKLILQEAFNVAGITRAQIRRPVGTPLEVNISVSDLSGRVLGLVSTVDAPIFGIDVSLQKARSAAFMSRKDTAKQLLSIPANPGLSGLFPLRFSDYVQRAQLFFGASALTGQTAFSERAIGNFGRDSYPDGINTTPFGPFGINPTSNTPFDDGLQLDLVINNIAQHLLYIKDPQNMTPDTPVGCTDLPQRDAGFNKSNLANGLQIFPGGFPIYRGNQLVGGIGVSGDGVDQDDLVAFLGLSNAGEKLNNGVGNAPFLMRASNIVTMGARPRYVNCPFAPFITGRDQNVCMGK